MLHGKKGSSFRIKILACLLLLLAFACNKATVPTSYSTIAFDGLNTIAFNPSGQLVFSWQQASSDNEQVTYTIMQSQTPISQSKALYGLLGDDDSSKGESVKTLDNVPSGSQPRDTGKVIGSVADATSWTLPSSLTEGMTYAFQVTARSSAGRVDNNSRVLILNYLVKTATGEGYELEATSGAYQMGAPKTKFKSPLTAKLTLKGEPVIAQTLTFTLESGTGSLSAAKAVTDANGEASIEFIAGDETGTTEVVATWGDDARKVKFVQLIKSDAPNTPKLEYVTGRYQTATPGQTFAEPLKVRFTRDGAPIPNKIIAFQAIPPGKIELSKAFVTTDSAGEAQVTAKAKAVGQVSVAASSSDDNIYTETTLAVDAPTDPLADVVLTAVSGDEQNGTENRPFNEPLKVKLAKGNIPMSGEDIAFVILKGSGATLSAASATTNAAGEAQVTLTAGTYGFHKVRAMWLGTTRTVDFLLMAFPYENPNDRYKLEVLTGNFQLADLSQTYTFPLKVRLSDNATPLAAMTGATIHYAVTGGSGITLSSANATTNALGEAFVNATSGTTPGSYEVSATWTGPGGVTKVALFALSVVVPVDPNSAYNLAIVQGNLQYGTVSTQFSKSLQVKFTRNNVAQPNESISFTVQGVAGGSVSSGIATTNAQGLATVTFTAGAAPTTYEVVASSTTGGKSVSFYLIANPPLDGNLLQVVSGNFQTCQISVNCADALVVQATTGGSPAPGEAIAFAITYGSGANLDHTSVNTGADGKAQVIFAPGATKGNYVVTATWTASGKSTVFLLTAEDPEDKLALAIVSGNTQTGNISSAFSLPLVVKLTNSGLDYAGQTVNFAVTVGSGATLSASTAITNAQGLAQVSFSAGSATGTYQVTATFGTKAVPFTLLAQDPLSSYTLTASAGNYQSTNIGTAFPTALKAKLMNGSNPAPGATISFALTSGSGATLSALTAVTNAQGEATITVTAGAFKSNYVVTASYSSGLRMAPFILTAIDPADTVNLSIAAGNSQTGNINTAFATPLKVRLLDGVTPYPNQAIAFAVTSSGGGTLSSTSVNTDALGYAEVVLTAGAATGIYQVTASWNGGAKAVYFSLLAQDPSGAYSLSAVDGNFQTGSISQTFATPLKVRLLNGGTPVVGASIAFAITAGSGASISAANGTTDANGETSITFTAGSAKGTYAVTANYNSGLRTVPFALTAEDPLDKVELKVVSGDPQTGDISSDFAAPLKVRLLNANVAYASQHVIFTVTGGTGAQLNGSSSPVDLTTDASGYAQVTFKAGAATGTYQVTASWNGGAKSVDFALLAQDPAAGVTLAVVSGNFQSGNVSTLFGAPLRIRLRNNGAAYANQAVAFAVTQGAGASLSSTSVNTDASGYAEVAFTAGPTKGTYEVTATWNSGTKADRFALVVTSPTDGVLLDYFGGNSQTGTVSTAFTLPLIVKLTKDGAAFAGEAISFAVTSGAGATVSVASATTDASGLAQVTFTAGAAAGTYEVTASWASGARFKIFSLIASDPPDNKVIEVADGNFQVGPLGADFSTALKVRVRDASTPLNNQSVAFAITNSPSGSSGMSVSAATATSNASGYASVTFHGGDKIGTYEVTATWLTKTVKFALITSTAANSKILKIVASGTGAQPEITTASIDIASQTLTVKAALYDVTGVNYVSDANVNWSLSGGGFNNADLSGTVNNSTAITIAPTRTGTTTLQATYVGSDTTVVGTTDSTGFITVTSSLTPALINIIAGDNQSATVGANLSTALKVQVTTAGGTPVPGTSVNFSVQQGGGTIITSQPVMTDANGYVTTQVAVGTAAMTNVFRATVVGNSSLYRDFTATATVGPATKLVFSVQPGQAYRNNRFLQQPVVLIQDQYSNLVNINSAVTMAKNTGTGTLSGTLTVNAVSGVVTFTDLTWNTQENAVKVQATATGLTTAVSSAFDVGAQLTSACTTEDSDFVTAAGGCKEVATQLVWGTPNSVDVTWAKVVWDSTYAGSSAVKASDSGWTNDYTPALGGVNADNDSVAYCHDSTEGGYTDWRVPSLTELNAVRTRGTGFAAHQSAFDGTKGFWANQASTSGGYNHYSNSVANGATSNTSASMRYICVRSPVSPNRSPATKIAWATVPGASLSGASVTFVATLTDSSGNRVSSQNVNLTLAKATGAGVLSGTTTAATNRFGQATFTVSYSGSSETATFSVSGAGLTSPTNASVYFAGTSGGCGAPDDAAFDSAGGGCRDRLASPQLIWSYPTTATWSDAAWDESVSLSSARKASDNGWTADYSTPQYVACNGFAANCDTSNVSICHDLTQGGYTDWRMPTLAELSTSYTNGLATHMVQGTSMVYWSKDISGNGYYKVLNFTDGSTTTNLLATVSGLMCVRGGTALPSATQLVWNHSGNKAHMQRTASVPISLRVTDASGNQVARQGVTVTVAQVGGTGTLGGTLSTTTDRTGRATFNLTYSVAETFAISVTNSASLTNPANLTVNVTNTPGGCTQETTWTTASGGCKDPSGKTWSKISPWGTGLTWHDAIWSANLASNTAADANDTARNTAPLTCYTNPCKDDYGNNPGANTDTSLTNYCHDLTEGGQSDWRVPTSNELTNAYSNGLATQINYNPYREVYFWTADTQTGTAANASLFSMLTGSTTNVLKTGTASSSTGLSYLAICVRP